MAIKPKNRYWHNGFWFFQRLRNHVAPHLAVLLSLVFLFANATFACVELEADQLSSQPSATDLYALDSDRDLVSTPVESREFFSGREVTEDPVAPRLDARLSHHQIKLVSTLSSVERFAPADICPQYLVHSCKSPFSPRPPPLFSAQA